MSEMKTYDGYAVYSETQFNHISRNTKCPYIYYKNEKDEVLRRIPIRDVHHCAELNTLYKNYYNNQCVALNEKGLF